MKKNNNRKKQGDPGRRSPRSPWGLPKPAEKEKVKVKVKEKVVKNQPENLKERERQQTRLGNQFSMRPLPEGMKELLVEVRQRPFPGSPPYANTGKPSRRKYNKKLNGGKLKSNGASSKPQVTSALPKSTTELSRHSSHLSKRLVLLLRKRSMN